jgi:hypothetical protein
MRTSLLPGMTQPLEPCLIAESDKRLPLTARRAARGH